MSNDSNTTEAAVEAAAQALWQVQPLTRENVRAAARRALEAAAPRTITTVEELDALPDGSAILDGSGDVAQKLSGWWHFPETSPMGPSKVLKYSATVTVIHEPEAEATA